MVSGNHSVISPDLSPPPSPPRDLPRSATLGWLQELEADPQAQLAKVCQAFPLLKRTTDQKARDSIPLRHTIGEEQIPFRADEHGAGCGRSAIAFRIP
jgi:hypothetical protein